MNVTCNVDQLRSPTQMELLKLKKKKKTRRFGLIIAFQHTVAILNSLIW